MQLYHYTRKEWADSIVRDGVILPTESNVRLDRPHAGPDVVWLTATDDWSVDHGGQSEWNGKLECRFVVEVDDAMRWTSWCIKENVSNRIQRGMRASAADWPNFYVVERPILANEIVGLEFNPNHRSGLHRLMALATA